MSEEVGRYYLYVWRVWAPSLPNGQPGFVRGGGGAVTFRGDGRHFLALSKWVPSKSRGARGGREDCSTVMLGAG